MINMVIRDESTVDIVAVRRVNLSAFILPLDPDYLPGKSGLIKYHLVFNCA